jgi:hypothetical protein
MLSCLTRVASHAAHNDAVSAPSLYTVSSGNYTQYSHDSFTVLVFSTSGSISFNGAANKTVNCAVVAGGGRAGLSRERIRRRRIRRRSLFDLDTDTCSFVVGSGGAVPTALGQGNGQSSPISFSTNTGFNRTAEGGGRGASYPSNGVSAAAGSGGCGGAGPADATLKGFNNGALGAALDSEHLPDSGSVGYPGGFGFWNSTYGPSGGGGGMACGGYSCGGRNVGFFDAQRDESKLYAEHQLLSL